MNASPQVSVVMSVYNGAENLAETLDSILMQEGCDFEFIVVDDGSTDATANILDAYANSDSRLKVLRQENKGLTRALINGCNLARGEFIARQDAGDFSHSSRLKHQYEFLLNHPEAVMCACAVEFIGPQMEALYTIAKPMKLLDQGLRQSGAISLKGPPHHGGTLFRRSAYINAGGYRPQFVVAQDIDLWIRLSECGECLGLMDVYYRARLDVAGISSRRREEQIRLTELALASAACRKKSESDQKILDSFVVSPAPKLKVDRFEKARFNYFIASCLRQKGSKDARQYFLEALRHNPFHLKALVRLFQG